MRILTSLKVELIGLHKLAIKYTQCARSHVTSQISATSHISRLINPDYDEQKQDAMSCWSEHEPQKARADLAHPMPILHDAL